MSRHDEWMVEPSKIELTDCGSCFNPGAQLFHSCMREGGVKSLVGVAFPVLMKSSKWLKNTSNLQKSGVIALDFSKNMPRQCYDFIKADDTILNSNLALIRVDVSRLPFSSGSVVAVHAGAALHCWPSPSIAVSIFLPSLTSICQVS
ncbi:hypothetical protein NE237_003449 [Protea cynaroides]|uniref:Methyltransferase type 11 domain-containing protein n=1 Tax=Protea cynaroides TaxID=273540 RepID=A0A9Q0QSL3_9MAGN|nr:hypothetical protein NE237_003449 [Protea cynaroides]